MPRAPDAEALAAYRRDGYVVARQLLAAAEVAAFLARNDRHYVRGEFSGLDAHRVDDRFDAVITHEPLLAWVRALLGGEVAVAQTLTFAKPPGTRGIALHQESYYVETDPLELLTAWVALEPSRADNGGLGFIPGSHGLGLLPVHPPRDEAEHQTMREVFPCTSRDGRRHAVTLIAAEVDADAGAVVVPALEPGDVVLFDGLVVHGSARNRAPTQSRHAFSARFVRRSTWVLRDDIRPPRPV